VPALEQDVRDPVRELVHLAERQRLVAAEHGGALGEAAGAAADQLGGGDAAIIPRDDPGSSPPPMPGPAPGP
jgi:hypothetical protein